MQGVVDRLVDFGHIVFVLIFAVLGLYVLCSVVLCALGNFIVFVRFLVRICCTVLDLLVDMLEVRHRSLRK